MQCAEVKSFSGETGYESVTEKKQESAVEQCFDPNLESFSGIKKEMIIFIY